EFGGIAVEADPAGHVRKPAAAPQLVGDVDIRVERTYISVRSAGITQQSEPHLATDRQRIRHVALDRPSELHTVAETGGCRNSYANRPAQGGLSRRSRGGRDYEDECKQEIVLTGFHSAHRDHEHPVEGRQRDNANYDAPVLGPSVSHLVRRHRLLRAV